MTAEVAILNREAVAIAADSAATVGDQSGQKIFSSSNKIFSLSKYHPVGIMIHGSATFMSVPWETIIKIFRNKLSDKKLDTLNDYAGEFISFLQSELSIFPESEQRKNVNSSIHGYFIKIRNEILEKIKNDLSQNESIEEKDIKKIISNVILKNHKTWGNGYTNIKNVNKVIEEIKSTYKDLIENAINEVFEKLPLTQSNKNKLENIAAYLFIYFPEEIMNSDISGVVITGFGEKQIFPSIVSYSVEGIANNILKYKENELKQIDYDQSAIIIPFAQMEMVRTFINGIAPIFDNLYYKLLYQTIENYPEIIIDNFASKLTEDERTTLKNKVKKIGKDNLKKGLDYIDSIQYQYFIEPILKVVTFLPKNELADMAESLVNLTCLRKKISFEDETVGGPIDVALISKGDGLIWIKRKHYFDPNLNQQFFMNYMDK